MNTRLLFSSLLVIGLSIAGSKSFAQSSGNANATVNLVLADARSISIDNSTINLNFSSANDYRDGVSSTAANHLKVISSGGFQIKVASDASLNGSSGNTIPANTITVSPTLSGSSTDPGVTPTPQKLGTTTGLPIVKCDNGTMPIAFDVKYQTDGGAYIGKKAETYTTTVTYEITSL